MGQVWEAVDTRLGRRAAVKTVRIGDGADPAVSERFHREAVATAALSHPGIGGLERGEEAATVAPATPSTSPPSETAASPTPSPAPTTTVAPPPTLPEALAGLRAVVEALPADVEDPDARGSLTDRLEALEAAADGPDSRLAQRLRDFIKGVDELEREGRLDPADVEALHQAVEDVAAAS